LSRRQATGCGLQAMSGPNPEAATACGLNSAALRPCLFDRRQDRPQAPWSDGCRL